MKKKIVVNGGAIKLTAEIDCDANGMALNDWDRISIPNDVADRMMRLINETKRGLGVPLNQIKVTISKGR